VLVTQGKRKRIKCCVSWHTTFSCILPFKPFAILLAYRLLCFIKANVIPVDPNIKDTVLASMWQGLILLPIAIIARWLAQPESPAADPNKFGAQQICDLLVAVWFG
jgi:hypothetical protein